jgi:CrcB protein
MTHMFLIGCFGAAGAVSRYLVTKWMVVWCGDAFPLGTLLVNVVGCCLLGFVAQFGLESTSLSKETREVIGIGFLGGLTTFSTFGWDTFRRLQEGMWAAAAGNVIANLVAGLLAVWLGATVARMLTS